MIARIIASLAVGTCLLAGCATEIGDSDDVPEENAASEPAEPSEGEGLSEEALGTSVTCYARCGRNTGLARNVTVCGRTASSARTTACASARRWLEATYGTRCGNAYVSATATSSRRCEY
jgi:hypothetical protein